MNIDLTSLFLVILDLVVAIIAYKVIPWIKAKTTNEQQSLLTAVTTTLVFAAEQLYGAGKGAEKLDYVIRQLEERGFTADRDMIEAAIKTYSTRLHVQKPATEQKIEEVQHVNE